MGHPDATRGNVPCWPLVAISTRNIRRPCFRLARVVASCLPKNDSGFLPSGFHAGHKPPAMQPLVVLARKIPNDLGQDGGGSKP